MTRMLSLPNQDLYARALGASNKARWAIEADVIRGRALDADEKYLPDGLSLAHSLEGLSDAERRFFSQVQGRTYANLFGLVERFINAKVLELSRQHVLGDQIALEALVRFSDEELKHQELFRLLEAQAARSMAPGYRFVLDPNDVATVVLAKSTWAVLGLTLHIELFTQTHYRRSIEPDSNLSPLFKDVFRYHFVEESQHAALDEIEWRREDQKLDSETRDAAVTDLVDLVVAVDGMLRAQAAADAEYFLGELGRPLAESDRAVVAATFLAAYRLQYVASGIRHTRFVEVLASLVTPGQLERIQTALAPLL